MGPCTLSSELLSEMLIIMGASVPLVVISEVEPIVTLATGVVVAVEFSRSFVSELFCTVRGCWYNVSVLLSVLFCTGVGFLVSFAPVESLFDCIMRWGSLVVRSSMVWLVSSGWSLCVSATM